MRSRATSGRTRFRGEGDGRFAFVRDCNGLASRVCLMALLASCMELIWLLEQPRQSILEAHRRIDKLWQSITAWKASWWMGCFNGPTAKPHYLICNLFAFCRGMETGSHIRNTFRLAFTYGLFHVCRVTFAHGSSSVCICLDHFRSKEGRAGYLPKAERDKLKGKKLVVKSGNRYTGDRKALRESQCLVILVWQFLFQTHFQKQSLGLNRVESWTFKGPTHRRWLLGSRLFSRPMVGQTVSCQGRATHQLLIWVWRTTNSSFNTAAGISFYKVICGKMHLCLIFSPVKCLFTPRSNFELKQRNVWPIDFNICLMMFDAWHCISGRLTRCAVLLAEERTRSQQPSGKLAGLASGYYSSWPLVIGRLGSGR